MMCDRGRACISRRMLIVKKDEVEVIEAHTVYCRKEKEIFLILPISSFIK